MILEKGVAFSHTDEADFEAELAFERRVIDYARPRLAAASPGTWGVARGAADVLQRAPVFVDGP